jgi:hypothetical protein
VTAEYVKAPPAEVPDEFQFLLRPGNPLQLWDIEFDGTFGGTATLTFRYDDSMLLGPEHNLMVFHRKTAGGVEKLPILAHDLIGNTITVATSSFSLIALAVIPEPSSGIQVILGSVLLCVVRRTNSRLSATPPPAASFAASSKRFAIRTRAARTAAQSENSLTGVMLGDHNEPVINAVGTPIADTAQ